MYWGTLDNRTTFRIFQWPDKAPEPQSVIRSISPSNFTNPDCSGGANGTDFIERSTAWSITGFRMRGALGGNGHLAFYWNVGPDAVHPQGHVHAAVFSEPSLALVGQPHIWSASGCFGYPIVSANERGDFGLTIAFGGNAGPGGAAAQGYVGIADDFTGGVGFFGTVFLTARGTHNPFDGRYGDYMTIHPQEPCGSWFGATNYALYGGTEVNNVNSRYIEFGKNRDRRCYFGWRDQTRWPL
jgi:hypothetical protein